jgi:hypothetical protein
MRATVIRILTLMLLLCAITGGYVVNAAEPVLALYAAPNASGTGDGSSIENAAYFRDAKFWQSVNATLQTRPVTVNLVPGQYIFSKVAKGSQSRDTLRFTDFGHPENQFVLQGLVKEGVIFTSDPEEKIDESLTIELLRFTGTNAVFRHIHFTGQQHMGYTTHFSGKNILIEECSFTDLINTYYGASGTAYENSEFITWKNNYFRKVGLDGHAHMLYNAYGSKFVYVIGNYFEDCSGEYVRFRDQTDYTVVYGNTFISTGKYKDGNRAFVSIPLFNDDNPANPGPNPRFEYFGTHMLVANNTFIYPDDNSPGDRRVFRFLQSGWDPPGRNLLLSVAEAQMLQTAPIEQRKAFMLENFGINADRIFFADNIVKGRNATNSVFYYSYPAYNAPTRGWKDHIDITATVNTSTVVRSEEEALAFWPTFIENFRYFAAPRADDVITQPLNVRIKTPSFELKSIRIALDGEEIYSGAALPTDLTLTPARMAAGKHLLSVAQLDTEGKSYEEEIPIMVEHLAIDSATWNKRARGIMPITFINNLKAEEYQSVTINLTQVVDGDRKQAKQLYSGVTPPEVFEFDSVGFTDGAYDFDVHYVTQFGITGMISQRVVLDNWEALEDDILPPNMSSWFGISERLLTVDRSTGWEFTNATPQLFFGDANRIRLSSSGEEYLTWKLANLRTYQFTLYVRDADLKQALTLLGSPNGVEWTPLSYQASVQEQNAEGWQKVLVEGAIPEGQSLDWLKFNLKGSTQIELGYANLLGQLF